MLDKNYQKQMWQSWEKLLRVSLSHTWCGFGIRGWDFTAIHIWANYVFAMVFCDIYVVKFARNVKTIVGVCQIKHGRKKMTMMATFWWWAEILRFVFEFEIGSDVHEQLVGESFVQKWIFHHGADIPFLRNLATTKSNKFWWQNQSNKQTNNALN